MTQTLTAGQLLAKHPDTRTPFEIANTQRIQRRKQLAVVTFGIELRDHSIMLESDWDQIAAAIEPRSGTGHPYIDEFWAAHFSPMTTAWIHHHPELDKVAAGFDRYMLIMRGCFDFTRPQYRDLTKRRT